MKSYRVLITVGIVCLPNAGVEAGMFDFCRRTLVGTVDILLKLKESERRGYFNLRTFDHYTHMAPHGLRDSVRRLGPNGVFLDIGFGQGDAIRSAYLELEREGLPLPRFFGVSTDPLPQRPLIHEFLRSAGDRVQLIPNHTVEELRSGEVPPVDVATDMYGAISYTRDLSLTLTRELELLRPETGELFLFMGLESPQDSGGYSPATVILDQRGQKVRIDDYLRSIQGIEVVTANVGIFGGIITLRGRIRRTTGPIVVPPLELVKYYSDSPPLREFRIQLP